MKNKFINISYLIFGICAMWLVVDHITKFSFPDYFYNENPGIEFYVGINVVSAWADFSFFTYHTIILFSIWCILYSLSNFFKLEKLNCFIKHKAILVFLFTNYLITTVLYTFFELSSGNITFGLYATNSKAFHNFGTNILGHYVFFVIMLITFIKIKTQGNIKNKYLIYMSSYIFSYYLYVLLTGRFMYKIEWYPYPIFDSYSLFGKRLEVFLEIPLLLILDGILTLIYFFLLKGLAKFKTKISEK